MKASRLVSYPASGAPAKVHPAFEGGVAQIGRSIVGGQVVVDGDAQQAIRHFAAHDEERVLQIDLVLGGDPLVGEFAEGENAKAGAAGRIRW